MFERDGKARVHIFQKSLSLSVILDARRETIQNFVVYEDWRPKFIHPCGKRCVVSFVPSGVFVQPLLLKGTLEDITRNLQKGVGTKRLFIKRIKIIVLLCSVPRWPVY